MVSREYDCYSLVKIAFTKHARTIKEYDVTMPVHHIDVTSQTNQGDVTMLSQKRPFLAIMVKWVIDDCS